MMTSTCSACITHVYPSDLDRLVRPGQGTRGSLEGVGGGAVFSGGYLPLQILHPRPLGGSQVGQYLPQTERTKVSPRGSIGV